MDTSITKAEFTAAIQKLSAQFAAETWDSLVDKGELRGSDQAFRASGGRFLREVLGRAWSAAAAKQEVRRTCSCGGDVEFREIRPVVLHTVLAGRDVEVKAKYVQCGTCRSGGFPLLAALHADAEGFTESLRALSLLAGVVEPYESASSTLLGRFADVRVSEEKIQSLVAQFGEAARKWLHDPNRKRPLPTTETGAPLYVGIDGGMAFVDGRWQEVKVGCAFDGSERVESEKGRGALTNRQVVAVRGDPQQLGTLLTALFTASLAAHKQVVVLGDGAPWIWNLVAEIFPNRLEILDWFHADEHISTVAKTLYAEGSPEAERWRAVQLEYLAHDEVDHVIESLRFLERSLRGGKRKIVAELAAYFSRNCTRMLYETYRKRGLHIGSGCVESAVGHVVQQRMKRNGMRWKASGADHMLALRSVYRSEGTWDPLIRAAA
jgi:hypothetical protein